MTDMVEVIAGKLLEDHMELMIENRRLKEQLTDINKANDGLTIACNFLDLELVEREKQLFEKNALVEDLRFSLNHMVNELAEFSTLKFAEKDAHIAQLKEQLAIAAPWLPINTSMREKALRVLAIQNDK